MYRLMYHITPPPREKVAAQCFVIAINLFFFFLISVDPLELKKGNKSAVFHFRDQNIYLDSRKIYCEITWSAHKDPNETALEKDDMVISQSKIFYQLAEFFCKLKPFNIIIFTK